MVIRPLDKIYNGVVPQSFRVLSPLAKSVIVIVAVAFAFTAYLYLRSQSTPWRKQSLQRTTGQEILHFLALKTRRCELMCGSRTNESCMIHPQLVKILKGMESIRLNGKQIWDNKWPGNSNDHVISAYLNDNFPDSAIKLLAAEHFQILGRLAAKQGMKIAISGQRALITTTPRNTTVVLLQLFKRQLQSGEKEDPALLVKREVQLSNDLARCCQDAVASFVSVNEAQQFLTTLEVSC